MDLSDYNSRVAFAIGTGRCGTHFINRVMRLEPVVASWHERHPISDAFHRYCQWYQLGVDDAGFIESKRSGIREDLSANAFSFEASAYLSLSVKLLYETFGAKFILLTRRPDKMVNSYIQKGWYSCPLVRTNHNLPAGYQPGVKVAHHPFSRIAPVGDEALKWYKYSQVGKLAWFWRVINQRVIRLFQEIPMSNSKIVQIEDFFYEKYISMAKYLGFSTCLTQSQYNELANSRPGTLYPVRTVHDWNDCERVEFESEVAELAEKLGYEWRVKELCKVTEPKLRRKKASVYRRVLNKVAHVKRVIVNSAQEL
jgi:hypothetical protein